MNILAIGAHFDDVELGCGGTLARHVQQGDHVFVFVATISGFSNQDQEEVRSSQMALAVLAVLVVMSDRPDLLLRNGRAICCSVSTCWPSITGR